MTYCPVCDRDQDVPCHPDTPEPRPEFPGRWAPLDDRLWALAQLLRELGPTGIEIRGIRIPGLISDLEDAAVVIASHHAHCPKPASTPSRASSFTNNGRWNYG